MTKATSQQLVDDGLHIPAGTESTLEKAIRTYWAAWPDQRDAVLGRYDAAIARLRETFGIGDDRAKISPATLNRIRDADREAWALLMLDASLVSTGGPLGLELVGVEPDFGKIATPEDIPAIAVSTSAELLSRPPVQLSGEVWGEARRAVYVSGAFEGVALTDLVGHVKSAQALLGALDAPDARFEDLRTAYRAFAREFWTWHAGQQTAEEASTADRVARIQLPRAIPQPTFPEAKRVARSLALAPEGIGWSEIIGEFALIHDEKDGADHSLRLEGGLIPEWWGRPSDNASLRREIAETGHDGIAVLYNAIGLVLHSDEGHVDVEIDDLISRVGIDPRSRAERVDARLKVWRILTILGALRVVGARRRVVRDRVTGESVHLESADPLLSVSAWKRVGTQETFDAGVAPLAVTIMSSPWLARWRGNRAALQDFGNLLAISEIPIGKPSGAWARAIGWALQQLWREQATRATYGRTGDDHRPTVKFRSFTRRELLDLFPPKPSVRDVLDGKNPRRAIDYWERAIDELKQRGTVTHYAGSRDWSERARKGWAELWLDEPLDIRPAAESTTAAHSIATSAKKKRRSDSKLRESPSRR